MPAGDSLVLRFGLSSGLRLCQYFAAFLGAVAILITPAGPGWKLGVLSLLILVAVKACTAANKKNHAGWVELRTDGTAHISFRDGKNIMALWKGNAWAIHWFCVMALFEPESGRHYHCVVCASRNSPDEYRRLLKYLNMHTPAANPEKAIKW